MQFGGKLISFENIKGDHGGAPVSRSVQVSQVVTEPVLVQKSSQLEQALEYGNFTGFCNIGCFVSFFNDFFSQITVVPKPTPLMTSIKSIFGTFYERILKKILESKF